MGKFGSGPMGGTDGYSTHKCNGLFQEDKETLNLQNQLKVGAALSTLLLVHFA